MVFRPATKAKEDADHLRDRLKWAVEETHRSVASAEEEKSWLEEIDGIVSYYLPSGHSEYLKLKEPPANPRGGALP